MLSLGSDQAEYRAAVLLLQCLHLDCQLQVGLSQYFEKAAVHFFSVVPTRWTPFRTL